jgi:hypothetical protein
MLIALAAAALMGACGRPARFTEEQLRAQLPSDLGPDQVDVSGYPAVQQENYQVFRARCTVCHSAARSINAPFIDKTTWVRYVFKMHGKALRRFDRPLLEGDEGKRVIDFLAYDSRERKLGHALKYAEDQDRLRRLFDEIQEERGRARWTLRAWDSRRVSGDPERVRGGEPSSTAAPEKDAPEEERP